MYSIYLKNLLLSITQALFLIEHPHRFTSMVYGCSVGAPLGRLLMHRQRDLFYLNNRFYFKTIPYHTVLLCDRNADKPHLPSHS